MTKDVLGVRKRAGIDAKDDGEPAPAAAEISPRRKMKAKKSEQLWLMSFSDMSLILMSFFILQLAFSNPDRRKYDNLNAAMKAMNSKDAAASQNNLQAIEKKLTAVVKAAALDKAVQVSSDVSGVSVEFKDALLFEPGSASLSPKNADVVDKVMQVIATTPGDYKLVIEGHTDDQPVAQVKGAKFRSNWDLSATRGLALIDSFKSRGVAEKRLSLAAYADTHPKIAVTGLSGDALKKARATNRRVVIRIQ